MDSSKNDSNLDVKNLVISYTALRRAVGILGVTLPLVLCLGAVVIHHCDHIQTSISSYYHTGMRDIFVGILCAVSLFMFSYKGYNSVDNIAGHFAGFFALGVAWLPTSYSAPDRQCIPEAIDMGMIGTLHLVSASLFFLTLSYFSLFLFTKSNTPNPTIQKLRRNKLYRICGVIMLFCLASIALYIQYIKPITSWLDKYHPVFWLESFALWAFGLSWLTKGKFVLVDKNKE